MPSVGPGKWLSAGCPAPATRCPFCPGARLHVLPVVPISAQTPVPEHSGSGLPIRTRLGHSASGNDFSLCCHPRPQRTHAHGQDSPGAVASSSHSPLRFQSHTELARGPRGRHRGLPPDPLAPCGTSVLTLCVRGPGCNPHWWDSYYHHMAWGLSTCILEPDSTGSNPSSPSDELCHFGQTVHPFCALVPHQCHSNANGTCLLLLCCAHSKCLERCWARRTHAVNIQRTEFYSPIIL